jgi:hypothetical protein
VPILNAGECAHKIADIRSIDASRNAHAHSLTAAVRVAHAVTIDWAATSRRDGRPSPRFHPGPVLLAQVAAVVHDALDAERAIWPAEERDSIRTEVLLLATRVEKLDAGFYGLDGDGFATAGPWDQHRLTWIQGSYGNAPALLLVCGDLGAALRAGGPGYRSLLQRAGLLGHAAWLSAQIAGLVCSISGRPHSQATAVAQQLGGLCHLLTVALGGGLND